MCRSRGHGSGGSIRFWADQRVPDSRRLLFPQGTDIPFLGHWKWRATGPLAQAHHRPKGSAIQLAACRCDQPIAAHSHCSVFPEKHVPPSHQKVFVGRRFEDSPIEPRNRSSLPKSVPLATERNETEPYWPPPPTAIQPQIRDPKVLTPCVGTAALLETIDLEFERLLTEREAYAQEIGSQIENLPLDTESLRQALDEVLPAQNRDESDDYAELLDDLLSLKVESTDKLKRIVNEHMSAVMQSERKEMDRCTKVTQSGLEPFGTSLARFQPVCTSRTLGSQEKLYAKSSDPTSSWVRRD